MYIYDIKIKKVRRIGDGPLRLYSHGRNQGFLERPGSTVAYVQTKYNEGEHGSAIVRILFRRREI